MPKVKTTYAYQIPSIVTKFPDEFMKSINNQLYCNLCNCAVFCNKRFLVDCYRNTLKHQKAVGSRSENFIPQTSQLFLRSSVTDFVEEVTSKAFLSADIPLYKLNNKHINLFRDIGHRLPSETTCRRTALQLSKDELKRIRNAVHGEQIFVIVDESTLSGSQYLNILVGSLETPCFRTILVYFSHLFLLLLLCGIKPVNFIYHSITSYLHIAVAFSCFQSFARSCNSTLFYVDFY